jgi:hypothetical protein
VYLTAILTYVYLEYQGIEKNTSASLEEEISQPQSGKVRIGELA